MRPTAPHSKRRVSAPALSHIAIVVALGLLGAGQQAQAGATLYSFGAAAGDASLARMDDGFQQLSFTGAGPAGSSLSLPFFNSSHTGLFVNNNGLISFGGSVAGWSGQAFPQAGMPAIIAPFWADVDTRAANGGTVWHRTSQDAAFLKTLALDVKNAFAGTPTFNPTFAEVVTWDRVGYYAYGNNLLNTFQAVIVSDGAQTYTMFKYPDGGINWLRGAASSADPGVGFDAGDGVNFANAVGSRTTAMRFLPTQSNTHPASPGTLAYRIDATSIGASPQIGGVRPVNFTLPTHSWSNVGTSNGSWSVNGTNWTALDSGSAAGRIRWQNGDSATFGGAAGTVTIGSPVVALRLKVDTSGHVFTSASAANSLQIGQLLVPNAATTVSFGGNLVLLTNENSAGLVWNGSAYVQQGALTLGQLNFTDNSVLVARGAGMVNGADLHLKSAAQVQVYTTGATTRASTLSFDSTGGGVGGTLDLRGFSTAVGAVTSVNSGAGRITNSGAAAATLTIDTAASGTFSGTLLSGTGGLALIKAGSGTLTLAGANSYAGGTTLAGGVLSLGSAGAIGASGPISFAGGVLQFSAANATDYSARFGTAAGQLYAFDTNGQNVTLATALSSAGGTLTKSGNGRLTLTGANSHGGGTTISGGSIQLNGTALNSAFNVGAGGVLSGNAGVGALTVAGTLAPGNSPGQINAGATTFAGGGHYLWEINDGTGLAGSAYDLLSVTGALTLDATPANRFTVSLSSLLPGNTPGSVVNFDAGVNHSYTLVSTSAGILGFSADRFLLDTSGFANDVAGGQWSIAAVGHDLNLQFTAAAPVPEPGSYALMLAGLVGLGLARRHRRA